MHKALWQLLWFDVCAAVRGLSKFQRSWRQLALLLMLLLFVGLLMSARGWSDQDLASQRFGAAMPFWGLLYLLATWLTAAADRGLVMRPAEIPFVVGGPFANRDVITLNLVRLLWRAWISGGVLAMIAVAYVPSFWSAVTGMWLLICVSLLLGMIASLAARRAHRGVIAWARRVFTGVVVLAVVGLVAQSVQVVQLAGGEPQIAVIAAAAGETWLGRRLLPPVDWMFAPLAATDFVRQTLPMLPLRLAVIGGLVTLVYALGGGFGETSLGRTEASLARRMAALRSGVAGGVVGSGWTRQLSLPSLPRLGGIGSVAWMQMLHSLRILPRYVAFTTAIVGVVLVMPLMIDARRLEGTAVVGWMLGLTAYADFLLLLQLPVGFLGPVAQRELLKSLPLPAWRIAVGQLAGPLLPLAVVHVLLTGLFWWLTPASRSYVWQTTLVLIPAAVVMVANMNLLGAWNIIRPRALQQRDALAAGRALASVWIFMAMLIPAALAAGIGAGLAGAVLGDHLCGRLVGVALGLAGSSLWYIALLARWFARWQPTVAEGGQEEIEYDR